ncbi:unnamed protein product [Staurois parvus]|uniref:Uncharacterized protein n=1 Tax=Staurois parvus TaxID=386267 RepID=A0ABN9H7B6_9NEOB|nr:unnamed protein product [Staurois parvus]
MVQCRGRLPFINGARLFGLCALPGSAQHCDPVPTDTVEHQSLYGTTV